MKTKKILNIVGVLGVIMLLITLILTYGFHMVNIYTFLSFRASLFMIDFCLLYRIAIYIVEKVEQRKKRNAQLHNNDK